MFSIVRDMLVRRGNYRVQAAAVNALHEASEMMLVQLFEDTTMLCHHRSRQTINTADVDLALYLRNMLP